MARTRHPRQPRWFSKPGMGKVLRRFAHRSVRMKVRMALAHLDGERATEPFRRHSVKWNIW